MTPVRKVIRPELPALPYRAGTHASFLETMKASLSRDTRLTDLTTRGGDDPSIALLDAWATVGDVLTFYQERIANEGYLSTATERRSVIELANLVGYQPRPGVAASVYLAYTLEKDAIVDIPAGSLARSSPGPGESQESFETTETLEAQGQWNNLQVRLTRPHTKKSVLASRAIYLKGLVSNLKKDDPLIVQFSPTEVFLCRILEVAPDTAVGHTKMSVEDWAGSVGFQPDTVSQIADSLRVFLRVEDFQLKTTNATVRSALPLINDLISDLEHATPQNYLDILRGGYDSILELSTGRAARSARVKTWLDAILSRLDGILSEAPSEPSTTPIDRDSILTAAGLLTEPSTPPRSVWHRGNSLASEFDAKRERKSATAFPAATFNTLIAFRPMLAQTLAPALANAAIVPPPEMRVYSVTKTAPFGYNAPPRPTTNQNGTSYTTSWDEWQLTTTDARELDLEKEFDNIRMDTIVITQARGAGYRTNQIATTSTVARADYGLSGKATRLRFRDNWASFEGDPPRLDLLRTVSVFLSANLLPLAEQPVTDPVCGSDNALELDGLYAGLKPGRWAIVSGERSDTIATEGVPATELLLIANVQHEVVPDLPGDKIHTFITFVEPSSYCYKRQTLRIYGNVVKATQGETRKEVLGSGNGSKPFQQFTLKQPPLTYLSAPSTTGAESTLHVYVNDVEWHETDTLAEPGPEARVFVTKTLDDGKSNVIFGNGTEGMRPPTGAENLRATYRSGIGRGGNVRLGQISVLGSKPLGVKEVTNPLRATGGADKDSRDRIRENAPASLIALERLVSIRDYAAFSKTFAGIAKASAARLSDGYRQLIHVTIAGVDDVPLDSDSDVYHNLRTALQRYAGGLQSLQVAARTAKYLALQAGVRILADYQWESVSPKLRQALLDYFSFDRRDLGQDAYLSEVLSVLHLVEGVDYVDVDRFGAISETSLTPSEIETAVNRLKRSERVIADLAEVTRNGLAAAQIAYFTPGVPATIALNQL